MEQPYHQYPYPQHQNYQYPMNMMYNGAPGPYGGMMPNYGMHPGAFMPNQPGFMPSSYPHQQQMMRRLSYTVLAAPHV